MIKRHRIPALLIALGGAMSFISCSASNKVTDAISMSEVSTPRIITVLQDPW